MRQKNQMKILHVYVDNIIISKSILTKNNSKYIKTIKDKNNELMFSCIGDERLLRMNETVCFRVFCFIRSCFLKYDLYISAFFFSLVLSKFRISFMFTQKLVIFLQC